MLHLLHSIIAFFFYLIANKNISFQHKLELSCIALLQGSDPNIMPNISQSLLSQSFGPIYKYNICQIFKLFLKNDYEKTIQIFKNIQGYLIYQNGLINSKIF